MSKFSQLFNQIKLNKVNRLTKMKTKQLKKKTYDLVKPLG